MNVLYFDFDSASINMLVEQWRPEMHTFYFPYGECTVTLEDVAFQLGLGVDGVSVNEYISNWETYLNRDIQRFCKKLLGVVSDESNMQGSAVKLTWFSTTFLTMYVDTSEETIACHTYAFILRLLGGFLTADASASRASLKWLSLLRDFGEVGRLSWSSAILATPYCRLCCSAKHDLTNVVGCRPFYNRGHGIEH